MRKMGGRAEEERRKSGGRGEEEGENNVFALVTNKEQKQPVQQQPPD